MKGTFPPEYPFSEPQPDSARTEPLIPPVPAIYEESKLFDLEKTSLHTYAVIHLRVPDSGISWLDKRIPAAAPIGSRVALTSYFSGVTSPPNLMVESTTLTPVPSGRGI
jgi:hypothetical protein